MIGFYTMPSVFRSACFCVCCSVDFLLIFKPISQLEDRAQAPQIQQIRAFSQITVYFFKEKYETLKRREDAEKLRDTQIKEALESVRKYPEYRKQSIEIQSKLEDEIQAIRTRLDETVKRLTDMEENQNRRERNKLRDLLLQNYRYYTNPESNPTQSWTRMEAEAFWELFRDYEDAGGNGYVHTVVQPAMNLLTVHDCASTE